MSRHKNKKRPYEEPAIPIDRTLETGAELMLRETEAKFQRMTAEEIASFNAKYEACNAFLVVQSLEPEIQKTAGGIIKSAKPKREQRALVILVGPGEYQGGTLVKPRQVPGQIVSVTRFGGSPYELEEKDLLIVHMKQVYVTMRNPQ